LSDIGRARGKKASKRLDYRLWKHGIFHQQTRKGKIVIAKTSRHKGEFWVVFGT
jgi:hypothetical protein